MLAQAGSNGVLHSMVDDVSCELDYKGQFDGKTKGKRKLVQADDGDIAMHEDFISAGPELCPITDKNTKPFPIMDLPTEIRLEIYRACLTRPYDILLSKRELPPVVKDDRESISSGLSLEGELGSDNDDDDETNHQHVRPEPSNSVPARRTLPTLRSAGNRSARPTRLVSSVSAPGSSSSTTVTNAGSGPAPFRSSTGINLSGVRATRPSRRVTVDSRRYVAQPEPERNQTQDPLITNVLRASKEIYKEARGVLYSENHFVLDLNTAMQTLGHLHQRSRRQIKHVELEIPTYNEILERFQETVRLSLRYCSGLKKLLISMPFTLPGADGSGTTGNATVYANGFDILRWLPQECDIIMQGNICTEIETVVQKHLRLSKTLDKVGRHSLQYWGGEQGILDLACHYRAQYDGQARKDAAALICS